MLPRLAVSARPVAGALALLITLLLLTAPVVTAASVTRFAPTERPGEFRVEARGFRAGEEVSIRLLGPSGQNVKFGHDDANQRGNVRFTLFIPRHFEAGQWTLRLRGRDSDKEAEATFEAPRRLPNAVLNVSQATAAPGTTLVFTSGDFSGGEEVSYWLSSPAGENLPGGVVHADLGGQLSFVYTIPLSAQPGVWQMTAYGQESDNQGAAVFTVAP